MHGPLAGTLDSHGSTASRVHAANWPNSLMQFHRHVGFTPVMAAAIRYHRALSGLSTAVVAQPMHHDGTSFTLSAFRSLVVLNSL